MLPYHPPNMSYKTLIYTKKQEDLTYATRFSITPKMYVQLNVECLSGMEFQLFKSSNASLFSNFINP
jgi:hypothetical protein